jgi:hypothetical protein
MVIKHTVARAGFKSVLATPQQRDAEQMVLRILADSRVQAARNRARELLESNPLARLADGKARLEYALGAWSCFLAFQEVNADAARPLLVWTPTNCANTWFGHTAPPAGGAIDNPDNIYRHIPIDGSARYELQGQLRPMHPAQFTFQLLYHDGTIPTGNDNTSLGVLNDRDMSISADGSFLITIDADAANGRRNHIQSSPGPLLRLLIRDTVTNWLQGPNEVEVTRVAGPAAHAVDEATVTARVADQLYDWVGGWLRYISNFAGPPPENALIPPYGRAGGWGYISPMRFRLTDDEAMIITIDDAAAAYASVQLTDVWTMATDPQKFLSSYTSVQSWQNPNGTYTYVVAPRDPGTRNWIDTAGMHQGWIAARWQGVPRTRNNGEGLLQEVRVVKASDLSTKLSPQACGVTPERRRLERRQRAEEWLLRTAQG